MITACARVTAVAKETIYIYDKVKVPKCPDTNRMAAMANSARLSIEKPNRKYVSGRLLIFFENPFSTMLNLYAMAQRPVSSDITHSNVVLRIRNMIAIFKKNKGMSSNIRDMECETFAPRCFSSLYSALLANVCTIY